MVKFDDKDARLVEVLARFGVPAVDIARELGVDPKTLRTHFGDLIKRTNINMRAALNTKLWRSAQRGSVRAMIYLGRAMAREAEREAIEGPGQ